MTPADPAVKDSWGLIVNSAWSCIEQTAAGIATISLTGLSSYTLSVANDAPDQSRQAMLLFTGQPAAPCTVTIPSVARIGWVCNQSNQTVILATATATNNLTVAPGSSFLYTCDGATVASVSIGGAGVLSASAGVQIANGSTYSANDVNGVLQGLLAIGIDNWTDLIMGGATGWRVLSQNGLNTLFSIQPGGAASFASGLTVNGPLTVTGTTAQTGPTTLSALTVNTTSLFVGSDTHKAGVITTGADSGGLMARYVYGNYGAGVRQDGTSLYLMLTQAGAQYGAWNVLRPLTVNLATGAVALDGTGAGITAGGAVTAAGNVTTPNVLLSGGSVFFNNGQGLVGKDSGGTNRVVLTIDAANNTNLWNAGGAGWRVLNQAGTTALVTMDNAGNTTFAGGTIGMNGNLAVSGTTFLQNVSTAAVSGTSVAVTGNVSGAGGVFTNAAISGSLAGGSATWSGASTMTGTIYANGGASDSGSSAVLASGGVSVGPWTLGCGMISAQAIAAADFAATSDRRLKSDIVDITPEEGYAWIRKGRPRGYQMDGRFQAGFVAQEEVDNGRREAVVAVPDQRQMFEKSDGYAPDGTRLARRYEHDIAYLTAALQGALARIAALEAQLTAPV